MSQRRPVYILIYGNEDDGEGIVGVFTSLRKAQRAARRFAEQEDGQLSGGRSTRVCFSARFEEMAEQDRPPRMGDEIGETYYRARIQAAVPR